MYQVVYLQFQHRLTSKLVKIFPGRIHFASVYIHIYYIRNFMERELNSICRIHSKGNIIKTAGIYMCVQYICVYVYSKYIQIVSHFLLFVIGDK